MRGFLSFWRGACSGGSARRVFDPLNDSPAKETHMSTYDLGAIVEQRREAVGGEAVDFDWKGETYSIPHPLFVDDDFKDGLEFVETDVELAEYYLGEEQYAKFREADGKSGFIAILLQKVQRDSADSDEDGNPTRRSKSSGRGQKRQKRR